LRELFTEPGAVHHYERVHLPKLLAESDRGDHPLEDLIALVEASAAACVRMALFGKGDQ
jgi:hypothetical protein